MCEAEKAQPDLQVLGTVTAKAVGKALFPLMHSSERDLGILEAGADPGPRQGLQQARLDRGGAAAGAARCHRGPC